MDCTYCIHNEVCKEELKEQLLRATQLLDKTDVCNINHCEYHLIKTELQVDEKRDRCAEIKFGDKLYVVNCSGDMAVFSVIWVQREIVDGKCVGSLKLSPIESFFNMGEFDYSFGFGVNDSFSSTVTITFDTLYRHLDNYMFLDEQAAVRKLGETIIELDSDNLLQDKVFHEVYSNKKLWRVDPFCLSEYEVVGVELKKNTANIIFKVVNKTARNEVQTELTFKTLVALYGTCIFTDRAKAQKQLENYNLRYGYN